MNRNLNRRIHPIAEANGLSPKNLVIMTRNDLIDKEVAEKLSKEVVSYIIEQVTKYERN